MCLHFNKIFYLQKQVKGCVWPTDRGWGTPAINGSGNNMLYLWTMTLQKQLYKLPCIKDSVCCFLDSSSFWHMQPEYASLVLFLFKLLPKALDLMFALLHINGELWNIHNFVNTLKTHCLTHSRCFIYWSLTDLFKNADPIWGRENIITFIGLSALHEILGTSLNFFN